MSDLINIELRNQSFTRFNTRKQVFNEHYFKKTFTYFQNKALTKRQSLNLARALVQTHTRALTNLSSGNEA